MKKIILLIVLQVPLVTGLFAQEKSDAILGEWLSEKKDSKFLIYKQNSKYFGKVIWGTGTETRDVKNPDLALRARDLIGLEILKDFEFDGEKIWEDGTIYDPREGKTYSCKITLTNQNVLSVRGYVGISLFGRSETWTRIN